MKKSLFYILIGMVLVLGGCGEPPAPPTYSEAIKQYALDESKTITPMQDGKINGIVKKYHRNGKLWSTETYVNGEKQGPAEYYTIVYSKDWYINSKNFLYAKSNYTKGKRHGTTYMYDSTGSLVGETPYVDGKIDGIVKVFYSGRTKATTSYRNGKKHGTAKEYEYDDTSKKMLINKITNYKDGFKDGVYKDYGYTRARKYRYRWGGGVSYMGEGDTQLSNQTYYKEGVEVGPRTYHYTHEGKRTQDKPIYFDKASVQERINAKKRKNKQKV